MLYDLTIIGAGPIGLFAAYYAGLRQLNTIVLEADTIGGQLTNQYPNSKILDVPGHTEILAKDLVTNLYDQAIRSFDYNEFIRWEGSPNLSIIKSTDHFIITTENKLLSPDIRTKAILLATGAGFSTAKRYQINLDGDYLDTLIDNVNYDRNNKFNLSGKTYTELPSVVVLGGGNTAIDYCIDMINEPCNLIIINRSVLKAHEKNVSTLRENSKRAKIYENSIITEIRNNYLIVTNIETGTKSFIKFDHISSFLGNNLVNTIDFIKLNIEKKGDYYMIDEKSQTNIPLLYAAGDCAYSEYGMKLLVCGFSQATIAVNHCKSVLSNKGMFGGYTSMEK